MLDRSPNAASQQLLYTPIIPTYDALTCACMNRASDVSWDYWKLLGGVQTA